MQGNAIEICWPVRQSASSSSVNMIKSKPPIPFSFTLPHSRPFHLPISPYQRHIGEMFICIKSSFSVNGPYPFIPLQPQIVSPICRLFAVRALPHSGCQVPIAACPAGSIARCLHPVAAFPSFIRWCCPWVGQCWCTRCGDTRAEIRLVKMARDGTNDQHADFTLCCLSNLSDQMHFLPFVCQI